jgi:hypothetical protein
VEGTTCHYQPVDVRGDGPAPGRFGRPRHRAGRGPASGGRRAVSRSRLGWRYRAARWSSSGELTWRLRRQGSRTQRVVDADHCDPHLVVEATDRLKLSSLPYSSRMVRGSSSVPQAEDKRGSCRRSCSRVWSSSPTRRADVVDYQGRERRPRGRGITRSAAAISSIEGRARLIATGTYLVRPGAQTARFGGSWNSRLTLPDDGEDGLRDLARSVGQQEVATHVTGPIVSWE